MKTTDRRTFIKTTVSAAAVAALAPRLLAQTSGKKDFEGPLPCAPTAWKKHGIILEATEPWEGRGIQNFTSPAEPLPNGEWRIWYSISGSRTGLGIAYADGEPGKPMRKFPAQCSASEPEDAPFAIGNLPDKWRPVQVVHIRLRNGKHRIYFWAHGPGILRYLAAESVDGRRYRVINLNRPVLYHPNDRAAQGVASPDGMMLRKQQSKDRPENESLALPRLISNDATNIYQLPDGTFEMYSVALVPVPKTDPAYMPHDNAPGMIRLIDRYTSEDGLRFETRTRVIQRDAQDPVDQQFYYLASTRTSKGCVGMLGNYRCEAQTMDLEWCFSPDGTKWQRPVRQAWLPRSEPPAVDSYGIYGNSQLVQHGGKWHLFYTAVNSAHNGKQSHGKPRQVIMYASTDSIWA